MKPNHKLSYAICSILGVNGASALAADAPGESSDAISEITVTAQRRTENIQDVPITIQALTAESLSQLNVATFDDFVKYLPNVTTGTIGPGQGNIYMRGLSTGAGGTQGYGSVGQFPNVAVYLDDQSTALPGRNLDVYAADMERVEVLEGPQGTLFGAGAEAGVVRYITNKPKLDRTEGAVTADYGTTAHGDPNSKVEAMINLPLIPDTLAVRAVVYDDARGGYITNQQSIFQRLPTDYGLAHHNGGVVPTDSVVINNDNLSGPAINPLTYQGLRVSALLKLNDDWNALLVQSYQNMNAQGVFYEMPIGSELTPLPPLSVTLFNPSYDKDKYENTALTINGQFGPVKAVYSGSYLVRNVDQVQDYTNYARGAYGYYYQCAGYSKTNANAGTCYTPSSVWKDQERNTNQSHELRASTPDDWRIRGLLGLFWQKQIIEDDTQWLYRSVPTCSPTGLDVNCYLNTQPFPGQPVFNPSSFSQPDLGFSDDFTRQYTQKAVFGSIDVDIIPKVLTATFGTRYFNINNSQFGGNPGSFYCKQFTPTTYFGPCPTSVEYGNLLTAQNTTSSHKSRANLSWKPTQDTMLYYTWSQGFRVAGFNRSSLAVDKDAAGIPQYITPLSFNSDQLTNNEFGFKTEWLDHRLQVNGTYYKEQWNGVPLPVFAPEDGLGNLTFVVDGPNFVVKGFELQIVGRVVQGLTIQGSAAWNSSNQVTNPSVVDNNCSGGVSGGVAFPASPGCGKSLPLVTPLFTPVGSPLGESPPFEANLRARYEWAFGEYHAFAQVGGSHQAHSYGSLAVNPVVMPNWTQYDALVGFTKGDWGFQFFGQNLTDVNASLLTTSTIGGSLITETPTRPRVLGLRFDYRFADLK
ncbi:MAG: TonB-dependent receptor [Steroidobacteraceae bacterium]